jgi:hypothetical protein
MTCFTLKQSTSDITAVDSKSVLNWNTFSVAFVPHSYYMSDIYNILADIPGVTLVFIYPTPDSCSNTHTHTHTQIHTDTHTHTNSYPGIYLSQSAIRQTHIQPFIYIYMKFLYKHIVICVPSLIEIAPGVPELCLSGVIYHRILHWAEAQKFRYFTVMWHRSWSARFTSLNTNGRMFVCIVMF